ncbi:MAG: hypothetical protein ACYS8W_17325 [Planctomycetota bacterium]
MDKKEITKRLDAIIALLAFQAEDKTKIADMLRSLGFSSQEVSCFTGIASGTLRVRWSRSKVKGKKKAKK